MSVAWDGPAPQTHALTRGEILRTIAPCGNYGPIRDEVSGTRNDRVGTRDTLAQRDIGVLSTLCAEVSAVIDVMLVCSKHTELRTIHRCMMSGGGFWLTALLYTQP